MMIKN